MQESRQLFDALLSAETVAEQHVLLTRHSLHLQNSEYGDTLAANLKQAADDALRQSPDRAQQITNTLFALAEQSGSPHHRALGLRARGNINYLGANDCTSAIQSWEEAAALHAQLDDEPEWAMSHTGIVVCLGYLGQLDKAVEVAEKVTPIFEKHQLGQSLFGLQTNLSVLHSRRGLMSMALSFLEQSQQTANRFGLDQYAGDIALNRSFMQRNMGMLAQAHASAISAETIFAEKGDAVYVAHAQLSQALTMIAWGRYNEALALFDHARDAYVEADHHVDAVWIDLFATNCWLQLGRYHDVLRLASAARGKFAALGLRRDVAEAILNEAVAFAALNRFEESRASFEEAHAIFKDVQNPGDATLSQLELAAVLLRQGEIGEARTLADACFIQFRALQQTLRATQSQLIQAEAAYFSDSSDEALVLVDSAENSARDEHALWLVYQAQALRGRILQKQSATEEALGSYRRAIDTLERLRGRLMTEFRADFLRDKERVYAEAVELCLTLAQPTEALDIVERARSRALIDLIAHRLDLRIAPRSAADGELVAQLEALQDQRNALYRRWMDGECANINEARAQIATIESEVTQGWHRLMVRNADYARDAAMTSVRSEPIQPYLDRETLLIEFFVSGDDVLMFLVSAETLATIRIPSAHRRIAGLSRKLSLNFKAASVASPERIGRLTAAANQILGALYRLLFASIGEQLAVFQKLVFVPHGAALHYLPFHALHTGEGYLCQTHQISYLPSASLLHYLHADRQTTSENLTNWAIGYSNSDALPHAVEEAQQVAALIGGEALVETASTIDAVQRHSANAQVLHLSTHGDFNQDNPLFSGLSLADGQLSTLDIFNMRLQASLVTLSACQTGRSVVRGGDELQGLMRAFLYAGASSLLLSLWQVHDRSTLEWMTRFYRDLAQNGLTKAAAVQLAQCRFIDGCELPEHYAHPWYWAPFFLVGMTGEL